MNLKEALTIKPDRPFLIACLLVVIAGIIGYLAYPVLENSIIQATTKEYQLDEQLPNSSIFIVSGNIKPANITTPLISNLTTFIPQKKQYAVIDDGYGMELIDITNTNITDGNCIKAVVFKTAWDLRVIKVLGDCERT